MNDAEPSRGAAQPPASRTTDAIAAVLLSGLGFALRAAPSQAVITADGVRLAGPDAHYHLRRIQWSVENFPAVLRHDSYVRFPDGGEPIWTAAFDGSIAALARLAVGPGDPAAVEALAVWVPPVLGAATVAVVYAIGRRFFGRAAAIAAGAVLAVLPAHVAYSEVGFVDHHVAVAGIAACLLAATLGVVAGRGALGTSALWGLFAGGALLLWPGALLHVALAQLCLVVWVAAANERAEAARRAGRACVAHAIAFGAVAPISAGSSWAAWGALSPVVLSAFQPLWLGLPALALGGCALAWRGGAFESAARRRSLLAAALALPALGALAAPELRAGAADALGWLSRDEAFQSVVAESLPLFSDGEGFSAKRANAMLSWLVWALPFILAALAARGRRSPAHAVLALWCGVLFVATLAQYRFANSFALTWALALGAAVPMAGEAMGRAPAATRRALFLGGAMAALAVLAPIGIRHAGAFQRAPAPHPTALHDTALWLRDHSEPTAGWLDDGAPGYGVLTAWGDGHVVRYVARRPVVQDNFGDDVGRERFDQAEEYFSAGSENEAVGIARDLRARFVLVRGSGSGHAPEPYGTHTMLARLYRLRGSAGSLRGSGDDAEPVFVPGLTRHRLVYESPDAPGEEGGRYKLFEIVEGAVVEGSAAPGELVEARLPLREGEQRSLEYRVHARAGSDGRYRLRLPYPTTPGKDFEGRYQPTGPYRVRSGDSARALVVPESAVRSGARIEGPDLAG